MKLQSLIQEETIDSVDISDFTGSLSREMSGSLKQFLAKFKSFNKIELNDVSESDINFHITDGIVDIDITLTKDGQGDVDIEFASMVNHKFIFGQESMSETDTHKYSLTGTFSRSFALSRSARLLEYTDYILDVAEKFNDWYFDLSGKYGKMKLTKIPYDIKTNASNSDWKWIPVGGVFLASGLVNTEIRAEIL